MLYNVGKYSVGKLGIIVNVVRSGQNLKHTDTRMFNREHIDDGKNLYLILKRVSDIILSVLCIIFLSPVFLITWLVVFFECPRCNPIFSQDRVGKNGKLFRFYKFRSMEPNAEDKLNTLLKYNEMEGHAFKIKDDPRITKVGKFLRKTSIDELPQLFNVIKGDMSLVGPRPPLPREVAKYDDYELQRLFVTPGITCYWQITANRNDLSFNEWVKLDLDYIEDRSLSTDFCIIMKTFVAVYKMNGV